jgi:hypothetical protein
LCVIYLVGNGLNINLFLLQVDLQEQGREGGAPRYGVLVIQQSPATTPSETNRAFSLEEQQPASASRFTHARSYSGCDDEIQLTDANSDVIFSGGGGGSKGGGEGGVGGAVGVRFATWPAIKRKCFVKLYQGGVHKLYQHETSSSSFYPTKLNSEYYWQGSDRIHCACWFLYVPQSCDFRTETAGSL